MKSINDEWARVAQNPDNMLVSDSLRESIGKLMSPEPSPVTLPAVSIWSSALRIEMELAQLEQTPKGWSLRGTASIEAGLKAIQVAREAWVGASISSTTGEIWARDLHSEDVRIDVDFHEEIGVCAISVSCPTQAGQTRVL